LRRPANVEKLLGPAHGNPAPGGGLFRVKGDLRGYAGIATGVLQIAAVLLHRASRQSRVNGVFLGTRMGHLLIPNEQTCWAPTEHSLAFARYEILVIELKTGVYQL
jgi:hypothetical protein